MQLTAIWVLGRNAAGRPTLPHALVDGTASVTRCGLDLEQLGWSRRFIPDQVFRWLARGDDCCLSCKKALATIAIAHSRAA
jgi:hypothetical protein